MRSSVRPAPANNMSPKFALVFWTKTKKISVVPENCFVKSYGEDGEEIRVCEGTVRTFVISSQRHEAEVLRICGSRKYLESLVVTKDGNILLHGSKPPPKEHLAKKRQLFANENDEQTLETNVLRTSNSSEEESKLDSLPRGSFNCSYGCPSCCSGTLPPFPKMPDGFVSTLVSLAEYFQQFQKMTSDKVTSKSVNSTMGKDINAWQWASREKVELEKGTGVWIDSIKLEQIIDHAENTKEPRHQTVVESLLLDLLGIDRYIETSAEKIDRRLISAVVGFVNEKYPTFAQPIERYYRCINLNRGYLQKRKSDGAFDSDEFFKGPTRGRRPDGARTSRRNLGEISARDSQTMKKQRKSSGFSEDAQLEGNSWLSNSELCDKIIIPLDCDDEHEIPAVSSSNINNIVVVEANSRPAANPGNSLSQVKSQLSIITQGNHRSSSSSVQIYDDDLCDYNSSLEPQATVEEDFACIEGALNIDTTVD